MMRRLTAAAVCLGVAALPLAGCGSKGQELSSSEAAALVKLLRKAQAASDNPQQRCDTLLATVRKLDKKVAALPSKVDKDIRDSLSNGVKNLDDQSTSLCSQQQTPTNTTPTPTITTPTVPPPTTVTVPPHTNTTPPHTNTTPPPTTPPNNNPSGGVTPGNGNGNGNGNGKGGGKGNGNGNGNGSASGGGISP